MLLPLLAAVALCSGQQQKPRIAPEFILKTPQGPGVRLSSFKGKVVVLAFLNTGCSHCQHFAQELGGFQKEYGPKGVQVLAVVFDNEAKTGLEKFRSEFVRGFPLGFSDEPTVFNWLSVPVDEGAFVPIVVFINKRGVIESQHLGDDNLFQDPEANIRRKLDALIKK